MPLSVSGTAAQSVSRRVPHHDRFFGGMSVLILAVVLFGFGPSFYLRPLFDYPGETPIVFVHAGFMTAWFVLFVVQTTLVAVRRVDLHKQLGIAGVAVAAVATVLNVVVSLEFGARVAATGDLGRAPSIVFGNFATLSVFIPCLALAVWKRRRPDSHRRLMLLASVSMTGQAWTRFPWELPFLKGVVNAWTGLGFLFLVIAAHDLAEGGRIARSTLIVGASLFGLLYLSDIIEASEFGIAFIQSLE